VEKVINRETMANPQCADWYIEQARAHVAGRKTLDGQKIDRGI
jgi:acetoacetyl-CoA synthetase